VTVDSTAERVELRALPGIPIVGEGDDLVALIVAALARAEVQLADGDILCVVSKIVSRAEGRFVDLSTVDVSPEARELAMRTHKDPPLVELVLRESSAVSRSKPGVLIVRHRLGFVSANAGIDASNACPTDAASQSGPWVLLLPRDPDASARRLRSGIEAATGAKIGVVITDSHGRPFRLGSLGIAIGLSGIPALWDQVGNDDLQGREMLHTVTAFADQVAAAADLVAGQGAEGRAAIWIRGVRFESGEHSAAELQRNPEQDLYA
jgi:coenzyme F420-0:L-glutamate ligase/coenzyme F420-1:gamma-L-glutamate ligase